MQCLTLTANLPAKEASARVSRLLPLAFSAAAAASPMLGLDLLFLTRALSAAAAAAAPISGLCLAFGVSFESGFACLCVLLTRALSAAAAAAAPISGLCLAFGVSFESGFACLCVLLFCLAFFFFFPFFCHAQFAQADEMPQAPFLNRIVGK